MHKQGKGVDSSDVGAESVKSTAGQRGMKGFDGTKEKQGCVQNVCVCVCETVERNPHPPTRLRERLEVFPVN